MPDPVTEAANALKEIEGSQGASNDPSKPAGTQGSEPAPPAQAPEPAKPTTPPAAPPAEDPIAKLREENEQLKQRLDAIERQKAQVPPVEPAQPAEVKNPLLQYSDEELIQYKIDHPEHAVQIEKELYRRTEDRAEARITKRIEADRQKQAYDAAAYTQWPDLRDPNSEHSKLTKQIMAGDPEYGRHSQGFFVAAQAARTQLVEKELTALRSKDRTNVIDEQKAKLEADRLKQSSGLGTGGRAPEAPPTVDMELDEAADALINADARPGTPEFNAYMRALEKKRSKVTA